MAKAKTYGGRWETVRSLGEGGHGHVFVVRDTAGAVHGECALKRLKNVDSPERRARFHDEIEALKRLSHPNVLRLVEYELENGSPYYVAEYCERGSLEKIGAHTFQGNITETNRVLLPVVDALVAAHIKGIHHRDLKPANILFRGDGTPVVGDFGICHIEDGNRFTLSDEHVGSVNYIAPEMESGMRALGEPDDRTDVYSLGKVLYWMLSAGHIFAREDHRTTANWLVSRLGDQKFEHVHTLLDRMVVRDPDSRLRSQALTGELEMTPSLVKGNFAPLKPSIGIRCRFCGVGQYMKAGAYYRDSPPNPRDYGATSAQMMGKDALRDLGLYPEFANARALVCNHCGHVELFHARGIADPKWWDR
jgi:serine/threonine protein kinase